MEPDGRVCVELSGRWDLRSIRTRTRELMEQLARSGVGDARWDLTRIQDLDAAGATLLWRAWGRKRPTGLAVKPEDEWLFDTLATLPTTALLGPSLDIGVPLAKLGRAAASLTSHAVRDACAAGRNRGRLRKAAGRSRRGSLARDLGDHLPHRHAGTADHGSCVRAADRDRPELSVGPGAARCGSFIPTLSI